MSNATRSSNLGRTFPAETLTPDEISRLLDACSKRSMTGIRARALIVLLWRSGLRIKEALDLMPKDIDLERGTLRVLHGKGDKPRSVAIDPGVVSALQRWLTLRATLPRGPVFCSRHGKKLATANIRRLLPLLAKRAGIEKRVHPHGLRHTHAYDLLQEGVRLDIIQRALGHASIAVTSRYLAHVQPPEVIAIMQARQWPAGVRA